MAPSQGSPVRAKPRLDTAPRDHPAGLGSGASRGSRAGHPTFWALRSGPVKLSVGRCPRWGAGPPSAHLLRNNLVSPGGRCSRGSREPLSPGEMGPMRDAVEGPGLGPTLRQLPRAQRGPVGERRGGGWMKWACRGKKSGCGAPSPAGSGSGRHLSAKAQEALAQSGARGGPRVVRTGISFPAAPLSPPCRAPRRPPVPHSCRSRPEWDVQFRLPSLRLPETFPHSNKLRGSAH